jgi:hypothetical protein
MKLAVRDEIGRLVYEAILVPLFRFDNLEILPYTIALRIEEDASASLAGEVVQCSLSRGKRRFGSIADCINCRPGSLAHVHGFTQVDMTVVVHAIAEKKNEVSGDLAGVS